LDSEKPRFFIREDGARVAFHQREGKGPGVVFLHGLLSDMQGTKALALEGWSRRTGRAFLRFDTFGHGQSSGDFVQGTIGRWAEDTVAVLDALTEGPQVLVGSSMGGWTMLLAALQRPQRIRALLGIAPAPDFSEDLMWANFTEAQKRLILEDGVLEEPNAYSELPYRISKTFIEEARSHLLLRGPIELDCPVRILQGMQDQDIPWRRALLLAEKLTSMDVEVTLVKSGDHRLSTPEDMTRMLAVVEGLAGG